MGGATRWQRLSGVARRLRKQQTGSGGIDKRKGQTSTEARLRALHPELIMHAGTLKRPVGNRRPADARADNLELVASALEADGVPYFVVRKRSATRTAVAIRSEEAAAAVRSLVEKSADDAVYVSIVRTDGSSSELVLAAALNDEDPALIAVIRLWRFYVDPRGSLVYGRRYACDVEIWRKGFIESHRSAPRPNVAAQVLPESELDPVETTLFGRTYPTARVFHKRMTDDIDFPIDVVYLWVDDADKSWQEKMRRYAAQEDREPVVDAQHHFRSRDELRYSLRSLDMFAPWVRQVFVVTDDQRPSFLTFNDPSLTVVNHSEIADSDLLPVFSSYAITSWIHHIPGLSEHYLYMNDDVFLGRDVDPSLFFHPSGIAKLFPSWRQPRMGEISGDEAIFVSKAKHHGTLLEKEFGRTPSHLVTHAPHSTIKSVMGEIEQRFDEQIRHTRQHRFRHADDLVIDHLYHYYAQITGKAVNGPLTYAYVSLGDRRQLAALERLLSGRDHDVFCLNDDPVHKSGGIDDEEIARFLERYFPVPSRWEL
jgi:hypothetical protein